MSTEVSDSDLLSWGQARARWVLVTTILGSALAFLDASVVNIALPTVGTTLDAGTTWLTWVLNAYALTFAALVLLGGALGDRIGRRRVFVVGVVLFAAASLLCGAATEVGVLVGARALQGVGAALLMPASLAILEASFTPEDRPRAIGLWSGLAGVSAALGPLLGGWLVQVSDWRWVFLINLPVAALVVVMARRYVPETRNPNASKHLDVGGSCLLIAGLGALTYALTAWSDRTLLSIQVSAPLLAGVLLLAGFGLTEHVARAPLVPPGLLRCRLFRNANLISFIIYAAFGATFFGVVFTLQVGCGFSPIVAGLSLLPVTVPMLLFSSKAGALMTRVGPRGPMAAGAIAAAAGVALLSRLDADSNYVLDVLAPTALFGTGVTLVVTPLTATALSSLPDDYAGIASGVNNAVARTAGLFAIAAIPVIAGLGGDGLEDASRVRVGFAMVSWVVAGLLVASSALCLAWMPGRPTAE